MRTVKSPSVCKREAHADVIAGVKGSADRRGRMNLCERGCMQSPVIGAAQRMQSPMIGRGGLV